MFKDSYEKVFGRMFQKVDTVCWDLMTGSLGLKTKEGILTLEIDEDNPEDSQVVINVMDDFGMPIPAYAQSTPVESVNVGDIIFSSTNSQVLGWVVAKTAKGFKLTRPTGTTSNWIPPKVQMLGMDTGVLVLRSLMSMLPDGQKGLGQLQGSLMPMMAMGMFDGDSDMSDMMPLLLMGQMGTGLDGGNMMQTMMMMKMMEKMGGGGGSSLKGSTRSSSKNFFDRED